MRVSCAARGTPRGREPGQRRRSSSQECIREKKKKKEKVPTNFGHPYFSMASPRSPGVYARGGIAGPSGRDAVRWSSLASRSRCTLPGAPPPSPPSLRSQKLSRWQGQISAVLGVGSPIPPRHWDLDASTRQSLTLAVPPRKSASDLPVSAYLHQVCLESVSPVRRRAGYPKVGHCRFAGLRGSTPPQLWDV